MADAPGDADKIADLAQRQERRVASLASHPQVKNARRIGTITALEVADDEGGYLSHLGPRLRAAFHDRDVLLRPLGNTVYVMPPYCIADSELDQIYTAILEAIAETHDAG